MSGDPKKRQSYQERLMQLIREMEGQCNVNVVPVAVRIFCDGDRDIALMLSHIVYWCDRGGDAEGFVWKSYREWQAETGLPRNQVDKATEWLKKKGLLQVKKRMAMGHPTRHYKLNREGLLQAICRNGQMDLSKPTSVNCRDQQIHNKDFFPENSSKTLVNNKGRSSQIDSKRSLSLGEFLEEAKNRNDRVNEEALEIIQYFLRQYERRFNEKHPQLKYDQWWFHVTTILMCEDTMYPAKCHKAMIDKYFETPFDNCDYHLHHYNMRRIKELRYYEVRSDLWD